MGFALDQSWGAANGAEVDLVLPSTHKRRKLWPVAGRPGQPATGHTLLPQLRAQPEASRSLVFPHTARLMNEESGRQDGVFRQCVRRRHSRQRFWSPSTTSGRDGHINPGSCWGARGGRGASLSPRISQAQSHCCNQTRRTPGSKAQKAAHRQRKEAGFTTKE